MKNILIVCILVILGGGIVFYLKKSPEGTQVDISVEQGKVLAENPSVIILDVRSKADFQNGTLPNAVNIDITKDEFKQALQELDKNKEYLVYCNVGGRSSKAVTAMQQAGFTKVHHMKDGIAGWKKAGLPITNNQQ